MYLFKRYPIVLTLFLLSLSISNARAAIVQFDRNDFGLTTVFSSVLNFSFTVDIAGSLVAGTSYSNPVLNSVSYNVAGFLSNTPSMFPSFSLVRNIAGNDFYQQGSSFSFEIAASADLSDGLQTSELVADNDGLIFYFNAREFEQFPPRYHPSLFELFDDGTGRIQNSNNQGRPDQVNPGSGFPVDVDFGEEYITDLSFSTAALTLAGPQAVVPLPSAVVMFASAMLGLFGQRRKVQVTS